MKIDILTLFPNMFKGPFDESIVKRAIDKRLIEINIHNLRKWTKDKRKTVDDRPYGGGPGMVLMVEPIYKALKELKSTASEQALNKQKEKVILLSPQGKLFNQKKAGQFSKLNHLIFICGHYEGFDERIRKFVDEEISIGDYVLTGGEIPTMAIIDSVARLIPHVLKKAEATKNESFSSNSELLDYPQYTRPVNFKGWKVPQILLSGNHQKIEKWRKEKAIKKTAKRRLEIILSHSKETGPREDLHKS